MSSDLVTLTATYRIVTPMFIGDANQNATGISPSAVKGALRFWWRALNWGRMKGEQSDETALKCLHQEEVRLFGGMAEQGGQGYFLMNVHADGLKTNPKGTMHNELSQHNAARYLGYGLVVPFGSRKKGTSSGQLMRSCINENQCFSVTLRFKGAVDPTIREAVIALGLLGGLGSRARHGLGSLSLKSIATRDRQGDWKDDWYPPTDKFSYITYIRELLADKPSVNKTPPYSAFSAKSHIDVLLDGDTPYKVLDCFGRRQLMYRSWGKNGYVLGQAREENFKPDHDWGKKIKRPRNFHPRRVIFGLPHNYGQANDVKVSPENHQRRASPLLFHVHEASEALFFGVAVRLPAIFLPINEKINAGGNIVPAKIEWGLLDEFIEGKNKEGDLRFPEREPL